MGEKNPTAAAASDANDGTSITTPDLKALIHGTSVFFDNLVELIPARYFLPSSSDDKPWYPGLSRYEKETLKTQTRENIKKSRRARLDPTLPVSSTLDLLKKSIEEENEDSDEEDDDDDDDDDDKEEDEIEEESDEDETEEGQTTNTMVLLDEKPVTYEELQERLRRKIAELSAGRNTRPEARLKHEKRIDHKNQKKLKSQTKKNKEKNKEEKEAGPSVTAPKRKRGDEKDETFSKIKKKKNAIVAEPTDITFGQVKIDDNQKRKKRLPKERELARAKKLEEAKKDPETGKKVSWKSAVSKAAGEKVHDDPKLLNKSIKREKRRQAKNAQKWKEREETVGKAKHDKQKARTDNIKERIHNTKMRKIEKREKKLMRPGFEGRKEGYING